MVPPAQKRKALGKGLSALIPTKRAEGASGDDGGGAPADPRKGVTSVGIEEVRPNRLQPRKTFDDATLQELAAHKFGPLAVLLPRAPGQKEPRWAHQLGATAPVAAAPANADDSTANSAPPPPGGRLLDTR